MGHGTHSWCNKVVLVKIDGGRKVSLLLLRYLKNENELAQAKRQSQTKITRKLREKERYNLSTYLG